MLVKSDLSDLVEKITWAKNHDKDARDIVKNARQFVRNNLLPQNVFCYHVALFYVRKIIKYSTDATLFLLNTCYEITCTYLCFRNGVNA